MMISRPARIREAMMISRSARIREVMMISRPARIREVMMSRPKRILTAMDGENAENAEAISG
jgi:hypothetical protein